MKRLLRTVILTVLLGGAAHQGAFAGELPLHLIRLPPGFDIHVYAENVPDARSLALGDDGTVFVGSRRAGNVYALPDYD